VEGVASELCQRFSKRHQEIDSRTEELLEQEPSLASGNVKLMRKNIAQKERPRKAKGVTSADLQHLWGRQLSPVETSTLRNLIKPGSNVPRDAATNVVERGVKLGRRSHFQPSFGRS